MFRIFISTLAIATLIGIVTLSVPYSASAATSISDIGMLPSQKRALYLEAKKTLDDWTGEYEKLVRAGYMIDSFIKTNPEFLPIYIEKARLLIMTGYTGNNDFKKANREALEILKNVQARNPSYSDSYVLAGHVYINLEDFQNAQNSLEHAERLKSTSPWLYNNWADLTRRQGQYGKSFEYASKALIMSGDNTKALVSAIVFISRSYEADSSRKTPDPVTIIFTNFREPQQRMKLAERLIAAHDGKGKLLQYAGEIIKREKQQTPNLPESDMALANLLLARGFIVISDNVETFDPRLLLEAEKIIYAVQDNGRLKDKIFESKFRIVLSKRDYGKAKALIQEAVVNGVQETITLPRQAKLEYVNGNYDAAIRILERLFEKDPGAGDDILAESYARLGQTDKLNKFHLNQVEKNPTSAWTLGNYASFLLLTVGDIDGAILYGNRALQQMNYPLAANLTSLAYLMKASVDYSAGNIPSAKASIERANAIGYHQSFVQNYCQKYCAGINQMMTTLRTLKKT